MNNQNGNEEQTPKEIGSNLTGTAIHAKPGHLRDIPIDNYAIIEPADKITTDDSPENIKNIEE